MPTEHDRAAWLLVALVALAYVVVHLDELALRLARVAPLGSC